MRRVALALVLVACVTGPVRSNRTALIEVTSLNWYADAVKVYCENGDLLTVLRGVQMGGVYRKKFNPHNCRSVYFVIEMGAGYPYTYEFLTPLNGAVCGQIQPYVRQSYFIDCTRSA